MSLYDDMVTRAAAICPVEPYQPVWDGGEAGQAAHLRGQRGGGRHPGLGGGRGWGEEGEPGECGEEGEWGEEGECGEEGRWGEEGEWGKPGVRRRGGEEGEATGAGEGA